MGAGAGYFDTYLICLTAMPSKQTFAFFNQSLVKDYNHGCKPRSSQNPNARAHV